MIKKASELLHPSLLSNAHTQREMLSRFQALPRIRLSKQTVSKEAAILIPVCLVDDKVSLLYTLRSSNMRSHRGQVSFPGGMKDDTDRDYEECAVREFAEETGIPKEQVHVWGCGKTIVPYAGPSITPVIASVTDYSFDKLKPSSEEVAKVFTIPIEMLAKPENRRHTQFRSNYSMPVFLHETENVWGITAMITHMFLTALLPGAYTSRLPFLKKFEPKTNIVKT
ncbi:mitochondrial coenzyme A diphosphatase NUDT8 [Anopheles ziemanni]|uniref:mitochondrial coenzyme A diphosphatase NUDT8 n=1 Tax=Anopheles coustani TaxID=139045 RepID=UPI00265B596C|nr:mitochondrial coenzyme A diphosphatase NUDT8 [Anopheles coustani]XP_058175775.1 mitochondrial coenzyme A diphosphatase NUDT8 [Anopheles ziemanni]